MLRINHITSLCIALAALLMAGCDTYSGADSSARFAVGGQLDAQSKQQFITVESQVAWTTSIEYLTPADHTDWITLSPTSGSGNANVMMLFGTNPLDVPRSAEITFSFGAHKQVLHFSQREAGAKPEATHTKGWLELPAFEADQERYYFTRHMLPSSGGSERSYSALYDAESMIPLWVAYPLCKAHFNSGAVRTNYWGQFDPNIPEEKQPYMGKSYNGYYDRGHMLPSASRDNTASDNDQTYYPSNLTPQLSGLNQKKWANIEGQVRSWAESCDTLYVVTGAVLQTVGGGESVATTYPNSEGSSVRVAIPNYYYKALLQYTLKDGNPVYQAVAIWVPHEAASGNATVSDLITIDQLEERVGIDLFTNLDDQTESRVESSYNLNAWGDIAQ